MVILSPHLGGALNGFHPESVYPLKLSSRTVVGHMPNPAIKTGKKTLWVLWDRSLYKLTITCQQSPIKIYVQNNGSCPLFFYGDYNNIAKKKER